MAIVRVACQSGDIAYILYRVRGIDPPIAAIPDPIPIVIKITKELCSMGGLVAGTPMHGGGVMAEVKLAVGADIAIGHNRESEVEVGDLNGQKQQVVAEEGLVKEVRVEVRAWVGGIAYL